MFKRRNRFGYKTIFDGKYLNTTSILKLNIVSQRYDVLRQMINMKSDYIYPHA